jgi:hypothetical protein
MGRRLGLAWRLGLARRLGLGRLLGLRMGLGIWLRLGSRVGSLLVLAVLLVQPLVELWRRKL